MSDHFKSRRKALGLSRAELSEAAHVDKRIIQLIELGQHSDEEPESRLNRAMEALENNQPLPDFKAEVDALKRATSGTLEN